MKIISVKETGIKATKALLKKPRFDEIELSATIRENNKRIFGEDLTAAELVRRIVGDVCRDGDDAIVRYTKLIDKVELAPQNFLVTEEEFSAAQAAADSKVVNALKKAIANVHSYHEAQKPNSWLVNRPFGAMLGQSLVPLHRVGIYVPGGTAAYPSSVIMNAVPAKVAGVNEIIMCVPPKNGRINPYVLLAAKLIGVDKIYKIGGAQAIAALAYGTKTVPQVDKITGPGNIFVTLAKKEVFGATDIDMLAGPSEILIVADESANPSYVAVDMLSQAEHDEMAASIVITTDAAKADDIVREIEKAKATLSRRQTIDASLEHNGLIIVAENLEQAMDLANVAAPEHMEILTKEPFRLLPSVKNAGAVFLGEHSPEPLGDYMAGPSHVLPTGGTARFYSVLNVETFMRRVSVIAATEESLKEVSDDIITLATAEGLEAHANAIRLRNGQIL